MAGAVEVTCYTDPGCSWAWGTEPKLRKLTFEFGEGLAWSYVMGGLVGNMEVYASRLCREDGGARLAAYWREVAAHTGMPTPVALSRAYRSTDPACRAVKAAQQQEEEVALRVLRRLRESIFVLSRPTDNGEEILEAVRGVPRLDLGRLACDLEDSQVEQAYRQDWEETRRPNEYTMALDDDSRPGAGKARLTEGHWRYVFPTVIFQGPEGERTAPGWQPYEAYLAAIEAVVPGTSATRLPPPEPRQLLDQYGSAATKEIEVVCEMDRQAALDAMEALEKEGVVVGWRVGEEVLWMLPAEAQSRGLD
ncbi:MAG: hypothetical protein A2148_09610 [Chloroflexi bacterium RBG_16_68_14]|nr:MAG: hypothetical protein A2148_09610 [Chloroflexi bacterium RBG_16_68_14]